MCRGVHVAADCRTRYGGQYDICAFFGVCHGGETDYSRADPSLGPCIIFHSSPFSWVPPQRPPNIGYAATPVMFCRPNALAVPTDGEKHKRLKDSHLKRWVTVLWAERCAYSCAR